MCFHRYPLYSTRRQTRAQCSCQTQNRTATLVRSSTQPVAAAELEAIGSEALPLVDSNFERWQTQHWRLRSLLVSGLRFRFRSTEHTRNLKF